MNSFPRHSYPYRSDSSSGGISGGLFRGFTGMGGGEAGAVSKGEHLLNGSISRSLYPGSPRLVNGVGGGSLLRSTGSSSGPYNTFNRLLSHTNTVTTTIAGGNSAMLENGAIFANDGVVATEDANSLELQHMFYGNSKL